MNRREFGKVAVGVGAVGLPFAPVGTAWAQGAPVEGQHYVKLAQPAPKGAPAGKIDVVEFFWYGCPHCNALEPYFDAWQKRQPPDVAVRRIPVAFTALHEMHAKIFYTLEAMGLVEKMHRKVFAAMHVDHKRLDKEADIVAFMTSQGVDGAKFTEMFKSFTVQTKARQGKQLTEAYRIDGVPAIGVQGRWYTSAGMAGGQEQALMVADYLVQLARRSA